MPLNSQTNETDPENQNTSTPTTTEPEPNASTPNWLTPQLKTQLGGDSFLFQSWHDHFTRKPPSRKGFAKPESMRKYPKLAEVRDFEGTLWDVRGIRPTKHGFDLLYGTVAPAGSHCGLPRLIATKELLEFWDDNRTNTHCLLYDLPAGRTTLKRVRHRFDFHVRKDTIEFYTERIHDLETLTPREFAARHSVDPAVACHWRRRIVGRKAREIGWWRKPKFLRVLLSEMTLVRMGRKLGVGTSQAGRLRRRAQEELQNRLPQAA